VERQQVIDEMRRAHTDFRRLASRAGPTDLRRRTAGTRWTNRQLMFHMVFGYLIVRTLMPLVHTLGRLGASRRFAGTLNAAWRPFHLINYLGSCGGGLVLTPRRMSALMDLTITALIRRLAAETPADLELSMHFPTRWDPYFRDTMTVLDVYHYGTEHYDHHPGQLTF
jgi:heme/copper-type cytochrome/quinol oxidase subunit 1